MKVLFIVLAIADYDNHITVNHDRQRAFFDFREIFKIGILTDRITLLFYRVRYALRLMLKSPSVRPYQRYNAVGMKLPY